MSEYDEVKYPVNINERYSMEITRIERLLEKLKAGKIYEVTGRRFDRTLNTVSNELYNDVFDLINKIQYGEKSLIEKNIDKIKIIDDKF